MLIISGHLTVAPEDRDAYLEGCVAVVEHARAARGCRDFGLSADLLDPARINVYERWENESDLLGFRGSGPDQDQQVAIVGADVRRYEISSEGPA